MQTAFLEMIAELKAALRNREPAGVRPGPGRV
jgi:hypothetical protein